MDRIDHTTADDRELDTADADALTLERLAQPSALANPRRTRR